MTSLCFQTSFIISYLGCHTHIYAARSFKVRLLDLIQNLSFRSFSVSLKSALRWCHRPLTSGLCGFRWSTPPLEAPPKVCTSTIWSWVWCFLPEGAMRRSPSVRRLWGSSICLHLLLECYWVKFLDRLRMCLRQFHCNTEDETFAILRLLLLLSNSGLSFYMCVCVSQTFSASLPVIWEDMQRGKISRPSCRFWMEKPQPHSRSVSLRSANSTLWVLVLLCKEMLVFVSESPVNVLKTTKFLLKHFEQ